MREPVDKEKEARKTQIEEARQRAIKNLKNALLYLEMPESMIDPHSRAWGAIIGISAAAWQVARMQVELVVQDEDPKDEALGLPLGSPYLT